jgi:hypothetical protein
MSLSTAARDVESAVREDTVPDANVRETVKRRVEERLDEEEDLGAFEAVEAGADPTDDGGDEPDTESGDGESDESDADGPETDDSDTDPAKATDSDSASTDGQVSMEDYL